MFLRYLRPSITHSTERGAMCKLASLVGTLIVAVAVVLPATSARVRAQATSSHSGSTGSDITDATLTEQGATTRNISTGELRKVLAAGEGILLLDTRPHLEWSLSHIPGALNVDPKPGLTNAMYTADVAAVERLTGGDKSRRLVLYLQWTVLRQEQARQRGFCRRPATPTFSATSSARRSGARSGA